MDEPNTTTKVMRSIRANLDAAHRSPRLKLTNAGAAVVGFLSGSLFTGILLSYVLWVQS